GVCAEHAEEGCRSRPRALDHVRKNRHHGIVKAEVFDGGEWVGENTVGGGIDVHTALLSFCARALPAQCFVAGSGCASLKLPRLQAKLGNRGLIALARNKG